MRDGGGYQVQHEYRSMRMIRLVPLAVAVAAVPAPAVHAADLVLATAPGSNWIVDGAEDSCRMLRDFGEGEDRVTLLLTQWSPGQGFSMVLAGRPMRRFDARRPVMVQFGDDASPLGPRPVDVVTGGLGDHKNALIFNSHTLTRDPSEEGGGGTGGGSLPPELDIAAPMLPPAALALADRIKLAQGRDTLHLQPTRLGAALAVFDDCSQQRIAEWGLDQAAHRTMIQRPEALNIDDLVERVQRYYPAAAVRRGEQGNLPCA